MINPQQPMRGIAISAHQGAAHDPATLRRAFGLLESWIAEGVLPGAAALVLHRGEIIGEAYLGAARRGTEHAVDSDTVWAVASVTKPFIAAAVLRLVERGVLSLDQPLGALIPDFLDVPHPEPQRRAVTLRHCLTHCSGLPGFPTDNLPLRRALRPLRDFGQSWLRQPLLFPPGTLHYYSNVGILLAAEAIGRAATGTLGERVEGSDIEHYRDFVRTELLNPLGMSSSSLQPPAAWGARIAWVSDTGQEGEVWEQANSAYYRGLGIPWGGLFSTPRDLARFIDLFMPEAQGRQRCGAVSGEQPGPRILAPATVRLMTSVQFAPPDAPATLAPELRDGAPPEFPRAEVPWGLGWAVKGLRYGHDVGEFTSPATFSHAGSTGTLVWGDPTRDIACVLLTNRARRTNWHTDRQRLAHFSNAVMAAF